MDCPGGILAQRKGLSPYRPWVDGDGMLVEPMEILGNRWKQGMEFRVSEEKKRCTRLFPRREMPAHLTELDSRWVKEAVPRSWASLGLAQVRPTYRSVDPVWALVGPSLRGSTGMVVCLRDTMGPPALLACMALFEHKYGID